VAPLLAEHVEYQIGESVEDLMVFFKFRRRVHESGQSH